jgi:endoglucanase
VLKPYHEEVIGAIREHDVDNIVICGTPSWSQRVDQVIGNVVEDENVAYALHYYAASHKAELRNLAQQALDVNLALFITEFGVTEHTGDGYVDVAETNTWWAFLDDHRISWCNWSIADKEENSAALLPGASALGDWKTSEITPAGLMVRGEIKSRNPKYND